MRCALGLSLSVLLVCGLGCEEDFKPPPKKKVEEAKSDNIVKVETSVPYGKTVACANIFDPLKVGSYLSDNVLIKDKSASSKEATSVCAVMRDGEPPKNAGELKEKDGKLVGKGQVLGVLPGDEYCTITLFCSMPVERKRFQEQCQKRGDDGNRDLEQFSCVHKSQRAAKYAYTYKTIHYPTKCIIEVMGGPSVTDEPLVQNCTKAALELMTKESLKDFK